MKLELVRFAYLRECTLGYLHVDGRKYATLEEPWIPDPDGPGGQRREPGKHESCVPDGVYELVPHRGGRFSDVWCLVNTAIGVYQHPGHIPAGQKYGRSAILIHSGNTVRDIEGCILVGLNHGRLEGLDAVFESRRALELLRVQLGPSSTHTLQIRPITGTAEAA